MNISLDEMASKIGDVQAGQIMTQSITIYKKAVAYAKERGILIADTKMEFGIDPVTKQILLIDELLTPDSSRFWPEDGYQPGKSQISFDKQYLRDYLLSIHWNGASPPPTLPREVIEQVSKRYIEAFERLVQA
jgi:phosphoribosylaminoimidazole-succinocarboxamide synthase